MIIDGLIMTRFVDYFCVNFLNVKYSTLNTIHYYRAVNDVFFGVDLYDGVLF